MPTFLIYGSNGYSGDLIAREAVHRGHRPILAGRSADRVGNQARELGLSQRVFELEDAEALDGALREAQAVIHCAGPFSETWQPMNEACLRTGTHYLDITGEIGVLEGLARRDADAKQSAVTLVPGVGFDVVPSDCLALYLKRRLPTANRLILAFRTVGGYGISKGTANTTIEGLPRGGAIRRHGRIMPVPFDWKTRRIDFGRGPVLAQSIPWGDLSSAYRSTGIPNIQTYWAPPASIRRLAPAVRFLKPLLALKVVQKGLKLLVRAMPPGPTPEQRAARSSLIWGEVRDADGGYAAARLEGPEVYSWTAQAAVAAVSRVLSGEVELGFQTPGTAFGPDFVFEFEGVRRFDVGRSADVSAPEGSEMGDLAECE